MGGNLTARHFLRLGTSALTSCLFWADQRASAQSLRGPIVRLAELEIDPAQVEDYKAALKEEIEASIRLESGVLALYAVSIKDHPSQIRILETYADDAAYRAHLETPHFKKYKTGTQGMVKSLKLIESDPIVLGSKSR